MRRIVAVIALGAAAVGCSTVDPTPKLKAATSAIDAAKAAGAANFPASSDLIAKAEKYLASAQSMIKDGNNQGRHSSAQPGERRGRRREGDGHRGHQRGEGEDARRSRSPISRPSWACDKGNDFHAIDQAHRCSGPGVRGLRRAVHLSGPGEGEVHLRPRPEDQDPGSVPEGVRRGQVVDRRGPVGAGRTGRVRARAGSVHPPRPLGRGAVPRGGGRQVRRRRGCRCRRPDQAGRARRPPGPVGREGQRGERQRARGRGGAGEARGRRGPPASCPVRRGEGGRAGHHHHPGRRHPLQDRRARSSSRWPSTG